MPIESAQAEFRDPLLHFLDGIEDNLAAIEKRIAALAMLAILLAIVATVLARVTQLPLPAFGEIAIVAMSPLTFVGGAFCSYMHRHITIDAIDTFGARWLRRMVRILASLAMAVFAGIYSWLAFAFLRYVWQSGERLIDVGTPVWFPIAWIVTGSVLMAVHAGLDVIRLTFGMPRTGGQP